MLSDLVCVIAIVVTVVVSFRVGFSRGRASGVAAALKRRGTELSSKNLTKLLEFLN